MATFVPVADEVDVAFKLYDNAYQSTNNVKKSVTRVINNNNVKETLMNYNLDGNSSVDLPQNVLLSNVLLVMKFSKGDLPVGAVMEKGWGYRAIRNIEFSYANSQILRYNGRNLLIKNLEDCETLGKRESLMELGGSPYSGVRESVAGAELVAAINIYLPHSNMSSDRCIPFDSSILDRPCRIKIEFNDAKTLFKKMGNDVIVYPSGFKEAYVVVKSGLLYDGPSTSIRSKVGRGGGSKYSYGYIYPQSFSSGDVKQGVSVDQNSKVTFRLDDFLNGSLVSMNLWLERVTVGGPDADGQRYLSTLPHTSQYYTPMTNLEITYASQAIYRADDTVSELINLTEYTVDGQFKVAMIPLYLTNPVGGAVTFPVTSKWTHVQIAQFNETYFSDLIQTGVQLVANQVMITFNTPTIEEVNATYGADVPDTAVAAGQPFYRLHGNWNYQAAVRTGDGNTELLFGPVMKSLPSIGPVAIG